MSDDKQQSQTFLEIKEMLQSLIDHLRHSIHQEQGGGSSPSPTEQKSVEKMTNGEQAIQIDGRPVSDVVVNPGKEVEHIEMTVDPVLAKELVNSAAPQLFDEMSKSMNEEEMDFSNADGDASSDGLNLQVEDEPIVALENTKPIVYQVFDEMLRQFDEFIPVTEKVRIRLKRFREGNSLIDRDKFVNLDLENVRAVTIDYIELLCFDPGGLRLVTEGYGVSEVLPKSRDHGPTVAKESLSEAAHQVLDKMSAPLERMNKGEEYPQVENRIEVTPIRDVLSDLFELQRVFDPGIAEKWIEIVVSTPDELIDILKKVLLMSRATYLDDLGSPLCAVIIWWLTSTEANNSAQLSFDPGGVMTVRFESVGNFLNPIMVASENPSVVQTAAVFLMILEDKDPPRREYSERAVGSEKVTEMAFTEVLGINIVKLELSIGIFYAYLIVEFRFPTELQEVRALYGVDSRKLKVKISFFTSMLLSLFSLLACIIFQQSRVTVVAFRMIKLEEFANISTCSLLLEVSGEIIDIMFGRDVMDMQNIEAMENARRLPSNLAFEVAFPELICLLLYDELSRSTTLLISESKLLSRYLGPEMMSDKATYGFSSEISRRSVNRRYEVCCDVLDKTDNLATYLGEERSVMVSKDLQGAWGNEARAILLLGMLPEIYKWLVGMRHHTPSTSWRCHYGVPCPGLILLKFACIRVVETHDTYVLMNCSHYMNQPIVFDHINPRQGLGGPDLHTWNTLFTTHYMELLYGYTFELSTRGSESCFHHDRHHMPCPAGYVVHMEAGIREDLRRSMLHITNFMKIKYLVVTPAGFFEGTAIYVFDPGGQRRKLAATAPPIDGVMAIIDKPY